MISRLVSIVNNRYFICLNNHHQLRYKSNRPEQKKLRKYLEDNKEKKCIICQRNLPPYILECAHIKPRTLCNNIERLDNNVVNWMCRNCHKIYDVGDIGIHNSNLVTSDVLKDFDFHHDFKDNQYMMSQDYFEFHFNNIFKK
jgi:hypothetical protein